MEIGGAVSVILSAYLIGSIPSALIYSKWRHHKDIRGIGDGNMGAANTKRQFGFRSGLIVALADILKGSAAVLVAKEAKLPLEWQILAAAAVILGHDYPIFAGFEGGQGFAATTGVLLAFFPLQVLVGFVLYVVLFVGLRSSDIAAGVGMGVVVLQAVLSGAAVALILFSVLALLFIPLKKWLDEPRREHIGRNPRLGHR